MRLDCGFQSRIFVDFGNFRDVQWISVAPVESGLLDSSGFRRFRWIPRNRGSPPFDSGEFRRISVIFIGSAES